MKQVFIQDFSIVEDLQKAGYTTEVDPETHIGALQAWCDTDCPLKHDEPFVLPDGTILVYAGTSLKRYHEYTLYREQVLESWRRDLQQEHKRLTQQLVDNKARMVIMEELLRGYYAAATGQKRDIAALQTRVRALDILFKEV